jgi:hypothetical protein
MAGSMGQANLDMDVVEVRVIQITSVVASHPIREVLHADLLALADHSAQLPITT